MGMGAYSKVLISVPFNRPLCPSGVSTSSSDLSGRKSDRWRLSVVQQNTHHFYFGVFKYSCNTYLTLTSVLPVLQTPQRLIRLMGTRLKNDICMD